MRCPYSVWSVHCEHKMAKKTKVIELPNLGMKQLLNSFAQKQNGFRSPAVIAAISDMLRPILKKEKSTINLVIVFLT